MERYDSDLLMLLRRLLGVDESKKIEAKVGDSFEKVDPQLPNGIYVYDEKAQKWVLTHVDGEHYIPREDGLYVLYFDNARCPACRAYDGYWFPFVKLLGGAYKGAKYIVVMCDWFTRECSSSAAKRTFEHFDVHASPTTVLVYVEGGSVKGVRKVEGVKKMDELAKTIEDFLREMEKAK